jgi:hypothetical protein
MMTWVYSVSSGDSQVHRQQLRRAADAAQRVLDLVRQVADQLLGGLRLAQRALLAVLAGLLLDLDQLDEDLVAASICVDDDVHRQRSLVATRRRGAAGLRSGWWRNRCGHGRHGVAQAWASTNQSGSCL